MDLTWWQIVLGVVVGLVLLMILVIVHELGHAIAAIRNGVEVEEFALGFPPRAKVLGKIRIPAGKKFRAIQDKNGKTLLTLNWLLPLGGFCKMKGESDDATGKGTYGAASFWAKTKILFAGVVMNLVAAMVIFTILALVGMPKIAPNQFYLASDNHGAAGIVAVADVVKDSPAEKAGIRKGDVISLLKAYDACDNGRCSSAVEDTPEAAQWNLENYDITNVYEAAQVSDFTKEHAGEKVTVEIVRDNFVKDFDVWLNDAKTAANSGYLGVAMEQRQNSTIRATWSAPLVGVVDTLQFVWLTVAGLGQMLASLGVGLWGLITGDAAQTAQLAVAGDGVAGPVGIFGTLFPTAMMQGPVMLFWLTGLISVSLAIMNILPIPALDGGRWYLTAWYRVRRKKLTKEKEESIVGWGMLIIFALVILITIHDVWRWF